MSFNFNLFIDHEIQQSVKKQHKHDYRYVSNLSSNEAHCGSMGELLQGFLAECDENLIRKYPYYPQYQEEVASFFGVNEDQLLLTPGSDFAIFAVAASVIRKAGKLIIHSPNYISYENYSNYYGIEIEQVSFLHDYLGDLHRAIKANKGAVVLITNPNGIDGRCAELSEIRYAAEISRDNNCLLIVDEAYAPFNGFYHTELLDEFDNIILIRSFSKAFGIAGLRMGAIFGEKTIIDYISRWYPTNPVSAFTMAFFSYCLRYHTIIEKMREETIENREALKGIFGRLANVKISDSKTNFVCCQFAEGSVKEKVKDLFKEHGIVLKDQSSLPGFANSLRITVPSKQTLVEIENLLSKI